LAASCRRITHRAGAAWHKGNVIRKNRPRDNAGGGAPKGQEESVEGPRMQNWKKDPGIRWQLRLKIERTSDGFDRKSFGLEFVK
jgi:hypothetical protein